MVHTVLCHQEAMRPPSLKEDHSMKRCPEIWRPMALLLLQVTSYLHQALGVLPPLRPPATPPARHLCRMAGSGILREGEMHPPHLTVIMLHLQVVGLSSNNRVPKSRAHLHLPDLLSHRKHRCLGIPLKFLHHMLIKPLMGDLRTLSLGLPMPLPLLMGSMGLFPQLVLCLSQAKKWRQSPTFPRVLSSLSLPLPPLHLWPGMHLNRWFVPPGPLNLSINPHLQRPMYQPPHINQLRIRVKRQVFTPKVRFMFWPVQFVSCSHKSYRRNLSRLPKYFNMNNCICYYASRVCIVSPTQETNTTHLIGIFHLIYSWDTLLRDPVSV